jgi:hypothetical protein
MRKNHTHSEEVIQEAKVVKSANHGAVPGKPVTTIDSKGEVRRQIVFRNSTTGQTNFYKGRGFE